MGRRIPTGTILTKRPQRHSIDCVSRVSRGLACVLLASTALATPALAQDAMSETLPLPRQELDQNGVNPATGQISTYQKLLSIGPAGRSGLSYVLAYGTGASGSNFTLGLTGDVSTGISLSVGFKRIDFTNVGGVLTPDDGSGVTLVANSSTKYTLTLEDGTVVIYDSFGIYDSYKARGTSITYSTGEKITLAYNTIAWCTTLDDSCPSYGHAMRLQSISSSAGYQLHYSYAADDITRPTQANGWMHLVSVKALNTTVDPCDPQAGSCTTSQSWPSVSFDSYGGVTDAGGGHWVFGRTTTQFTIQRPSASTPNYVATIDANQRVSSIVTDGETWSYSFTTGSDMTMTRTDPLGKTRTVVASTSVGLPTSITDENGNVTARTYNSDNQLTKVTSPEGNSVSYGYDARGNVQSVTRAAKPGSGLANIVSSASYPSTCTNAACNEPSTTTDERGNVTDYAYNSDGTLQSVTAPAPVTGAVRPQTRYTYASVTTPGGLSVTQLKTVSECQTGASCAGSADEVKTTYNWSSQLVPTSIIKANGTGTLSAMTTLGSDNVGNITTVDGPLSGTADTTTIRYDLMRRRVGVISPDPDGAGTMKMRATRITYNSDGNVSKVERGTVASASDADWAAMSALETGTVGFDSAARPATYGMVGSDGVLAALTQVSYDADGRGQCSAVRMNASAFTSLPADACTQGAQGSDGPDRITQLVYDPAGQVLQVKGGVGTSAARTERTLSYSGNGQVASLSDGNNNLTSYQYDGYDRLSKTLYPSPTKGAGTSNPADYEQLTYDAGSNVIARRVRDGTSIGYSYDNLNRVTLKDLPGSEPDVSYAYDNLGRLVSASQTANALSFTYDALSRNLTQAGPQGTVTSAYDLAGRRTQITYPGTGLYVNYDYLVTGDVQKVRENGAVSGIGVLANYAYDDLGNRTSLTLGNGVVQSYAYDALSRLKSLTADLSGTANDLTIGGASTPISYNAASQIIAAPRSNDAYAYAYSSANHGFGVNGLNQIVTNTSGGTTANLAYDARGNLISDGNGNSFCYSSENLLIAAGGTCASPSVALSYDPFLRLYQVAGSTTSRFAYDGLDIIADYNQNNAMQHRYVFGPGIDAPIVEYAGSGTSNRTFLTADERGSIIARSGNTGALSAANSYDEYGIPGSGNAGLFQYTGQAWIAQLGMQYSKARFYSPTLGRFMQTDPIGQADNANLYAYVGNDPVNSVDPMGLEDIVVTGHYPIFNLQELERDAQETTRELQRIANIALNDAREIVVVGRHPKQSKTGSPHRYVISFVNPCPASDVFSYFEGSGNSAPGAPAVHGSSPRINLFGVSSPNPISQYVNPSTYTIINTTLQGHVFYPGWVTIQVNPLSEQTSTTTITGVGIGNDPEFNDQFGKWWFGMKAMAAQDVCGR